MPVREVGERRRVGPDYNGRLAQFVEEGWRAELAQVHSRSLQRLWRLATAFRRTLGLRNDNE